MNGNERTIFVLKKEDELSGSNHLDMLLADQQFDGVVTILCENVEDLKKVEEMLKKYPLKNCEDITIYNPYQPHHSEDEVIPTFLSSLRRSVKSERKGLLLTLRELFEGLQSDHAIFINHPWGKIRKIGMKSSNSLSLLTVKQQAEKQLSLKAVQSTSVSKTDLKDLDVWNQREDQINERTIFVFKKEDDLFGSDQLDMLVADQQFDGVVTILCENVEDLKKVEEMLKMYPLKNYEDITIYNPYQPHHSEDEVISTFLKSLRTSVKSERKGLLLTLRELFEGLQSDHAIFINHPGQDIRKIGMKSSNQLSLLTEKQKKNSVQLTSFLQTEYPHTFTSKLKCQNVEEHDRCEFEIYCEADDAEVNWYRDGKKITPEDGRVEIVVEGKKRKLVFKDIHLEDAVEITCKTNKDSSSCVLRVAYAKGEDAPEIGDTGPVPGVAYEECARNVPYKIMEVLESTCLSCKRETFRKCQTKTKKKKLGSEETEGSTCFTCCNPCKLCGQFNVTEYAEIETLVTKLGLTILPFKSPEPVVETDQKQMDTAIENLYNHWSLEIEGKVCIEMIPVTKSNPKGKERKKESEEKEKVLKLFRNSTKEMGNVAIFPNFKPGPLIGISKFGQNLDTLLKDKDKRDILLRAFNIDGQMNKAEESDWKSHLNENRHENDLVLIFGDFSWIVQVETKGGKREGNVGKQFKNFKKYMERTYGSLLEDLDFVPVLAKNQYTVTGTMCDAYVINIDETQEKFNCWLESSRKQLVEPKGEMVRFKELVKRLLMTTSLVLTSLPQQLTQNTPDSHLILLRDCQWDLLSVRPNFAVIQGNKQTGKSMALELGLAFLGGESSCRFLVSMGEYGSVQNGFRSAFFKDSDITFVCYQEPNKTTMDILKDVLKIVNEKKSTDFILCIDDFPKKDLDNAKSLLNKLMEKSKYLWMVVEDTDLEWDEMGDGRWDERWDVSTDPNPFI